MRLHEAIRLGATMKVQAFGVLLTTDKQGTCAYGAALDAAGLLSSDNDLETVTTDFSSRALGYCITPRILPEVYKIFPLVKAPLSIDCPECRCRTHHTIVDLIAHLNDVDRWTRNAIADFIQPIEDAWWEQQAATQSPERKEQIVCT